MYPDKDALPKFKHLTSLCFYKKALSFFMLNKLLGWNVELMGGNPTKSVIVNEVINKVKKMEVYKQGKSSQARRALKTIDKFKFLMNSLKRSNDLKQKYAIPVLCEFLFHLIARIHHDTCQFSN